MKTYAPKPSDIERRWYVIDADGAVLGRLASEVAAILRGKHKPIYAPHADTGDHVIVINARGIQLTGGKAQRKIEYRHSGYPGGITATDYDRLLRNRPAYVVEKAVRGMLPKSSLGRSMFRKLAVYEGAEHPHRAQKPVTIKLGEVPPWDGLPAREPVAEKPAMPAKRSAAKASSKPATSTRTAAKRTTAAGSAAAKPAPAKRAAKKTSAKRTGAKKRTTAKRSTKAKGE